MRSSNLRRSSVLLCALTLALGCDAPTTMCPEGLVLEGGECSPTPSMDGAAAPDGGPEPDAATPRSDAGAPPPMPDGGPPPMPDGGPPPMPDGGTPPPLPDAGPPTCATPDTWYRDFDMDGQGDPGASVESCDPVEGFVLDARDCDDTCDTCYVGAAEVCDGRDNDCDGSSDEGVTTTYYLDADGDGHGNPAISTSACAAPSGYVTAADDCNDTCDACWTGAAEVCDGRDNDCDGSTDEGVTTTYYLDADGDGRGDPARTTAACTRPTGHVENAGDCDDGCSACWTGAAESCDGRDNDCDGSTDEGVTTRYYRDVDGDGHGNPSLTIDACSAPSGYVAIADDCNDGCPTCYPGRTEVCDGLDNDCDSATDEGVRLTFYRDADGDGHGDAATSTQGCSAPAGYVANATDCNDGCAVCYPGRTEVCDALDNDCDGMTDEGVTTTYYRDADGDGYGVATTTVAACAAPSGYVAASGDCNDAAASVHPGRTEACNAIDDDCDGSADETFACVQGSAVSCTTSCGSTGTGFCSSSCGLPTGSSCNPPGEICNGRDDDCDGIADEQLFRAGPARVDSYPSDFGRPETVRAGGHLYSFWAAAGSVHAWQLTLDGAPVSAATSQVPLGGTANYDVDGSLSGLAFAYVDGTGSTGPVVVRRLDLNTLAPAWTRTLSVSAYQVQIAVGNSYVFVYTREGAGRIYRRVLSVTTGADVTGPVEVGQTYRPMELTDDDNLRQYLVFGDTTFQQLRMVLLQGSGTSPILHTRTADFTENIWDVAIAADWSVSGTPPAVAAVALRPTSTSGLRMHYVSYANGSARVIGTIDSATTPNDSGGPLRSRLDLDYADGTYLLGAVRTTTYPLPTTGTPRVYQLDRASSTSSTLHVRAVDTGLGAAVHESVSVIRYRNILPEPDRLFYNPPVNGIASMPIGCY